MGQPLVADLEDRPVSDSAPAARDFLLPVKIKRNPSPQPDVAPSRPFKALAGGMPLHLRDLDDFVNDPFIRDRLVEDWGNAESTD